MRYTFDTGFREVSWMSYHTWAGDKTYISWVATEVQQRFAAWGRKKLSKVANYY